MMKMSSITSVTTPGLPPRWTLDPCGKHLNHGSFGAVPLEVQAEQERLRRLMEWNPVAWFASLTEKIAAARVEMAGILEVKPSQLAFVFNASAGASTVFNMLRDFGPVNVVVTNHGYGAVSMGARRLAARSGGTFHEVCVPLEAKPEDVLALLSQAMEDLGSGLLVIDQVTSPTARQFSVDEICRRARELGFTSLVDGAHAPGVLEHPVCKEADFWLGNLHKFALAPRGTAVLVSRDSDQRLYPLIDSWGAELPFPQRFDHTGTLDTTGWLTAPFAWRLVEENVGWDKVRRWSSDLADQAQQLLGEALAPYVDDPIPDVGQPVGSLRLLRLPSGLGNTHEQADALRVPFIDQTNIAVAFGFFDTEIYLRFSTHLYNSLDQFEYLAKTGIPLLAKWGEENQTH